LRRRLFLILAAVALGWLYLLAFAYAAGVAAAQATPKWWLGLLSKPANSALMWVTLAHMIGVTLVSLPFTWIIGRMYGRLGVPLALAITATICTFIEIPVMSQDFRSVGLLLQGIWLFGAGSRFAACWRPDTLERRPQRVPRLSTSAFAQCRLHLF
jgi:hypothetical protein